MDPADAIASRNSPFRLFLYDARTLFTRLRYLPWLFLPFWTNDPTAELFISVSNLKYMVLQVLLFVLETVVLVLFVPAFLVLPGASKYGPVLPFSMSQSVFRVIFLSEMSQDLTLTSDWRC